MLPGGGLVAIEAVDALLRVGAHLVLVDDGVLQAGMALGALARGANEVGGGLVGFGWRALAVDEERGQDQREGD